MCFPNNPGPLLKTPDCAVLVKTSNYFFFYIIFLTTSGPAPTHLAASTSSEKSSTRSSKVSRWSLQVWISLSLSLSFSLWLSTHTCLLSLFHFNLFQGGLCELQSIHTSWSWSRDGFQGERRIQPWDRVCKVLIFVNNWIHIANEDQWENLRSKLCLVLASKELAHRWFFKTMFYQILLSGTIRNLHLFQTIHKNINMRFIWTVQV